MSASWLLILFLFIFWFQERFSADLGNSTQGFLAAVLCAAGFFGSILLHELGHAAAARRAGIEVTGIELFMFGGFTRMSRGAATPGQEFSIAAAGPLVTALIVLVGALAGIAVMGIDVLRDAMALRVDRGGSLLELCLGFLVTMNVLLLAFNLVPAFPLDGGRIAQAAVWRVTGNRARATRVAAALGQLFAAVLVGWGIYQLVGGGDAFGGLWSIALGWLLGTGARSAMAQSVFTERLAGVTVADVMDPEPVTIPAALPAARAWEEYFLRYQGSQWFAVAEADGRWAGLAHRDAVQQVVEQRAEAMPMREVAAPAQPEGQIRSDAPLEALLASEPLRRLGVLAATDADGRLRGVVTREQVARALHARLATS